MESHKEFNNKPQIIWVVSTAKIIRFKFNCLCKNKPKQKPVKIAVAVNPGKYADPLVGNKVAPIKSPNPPTIIPPTGPYKYAANASGKNANPILTIGMEMERKRAKTISVARRSARTVMRWMDVRGFLILDIKILLIIISHFAL